MGQFGGMNQRFGGMMGNPMMQARQNMLRQQQLGQQLRPSSYVGQQLRPEALGRPGGGQLGPESSDPNELNVSTGIKYEPQFLPQRGPSMEGNPGFNADNMSMMRRQQDMLRQMKSVQNIPQSASNANSAPDQRSPDDAVFDILKGMDEGAENLFG